MKTKTLYKTKISGEKLAIIVTLNQIISDTNDYSYNVVVKETRNSFGRENRKHTYIFDGCESALNMYVSQVQQKAHHIAILSF